MQSSANILPQTTPDAKYPYLGIYTYDRSFIVFFIKHNTGAVVHVIDAKAAPWKVGYSPAQNNEDIMKAARWTESMFEPLPPGSTVTLIQD